MDNPKTAAPIFNQRPDAMASATQKQAMLQKNPIIPPKIRSSENILTQSEFLGDFKV